MRTLVIGSIAIAAIIALNELRFLGRTGLALVLLGLSVAVAFQGLALLQLWDRQR